MNMKLLLYILTHLAALCWAGPVHVDSKDPETGVLRLPIRKQRLARKIDTRDVPVTLYNNDIQYLVDLEIGNPAQPITLSIDTGSSDIWVWGPGSCENCNGGVFYPDDSGTIEEDTALGDFSTSYFDGSYAEGLYFVDTISIGSATVTNAVFAVVGSASQDRTTGIMGIGLDGLEAKHEDYAGFLDDMKKQGIISTRSYSIYLDELSSSTGEIIFGGYDESKWEGSLVTLPIILYEDNLPRLQVEWTYLAVTTESGTTTLTPDDWSYPVVLDTGYTTTVLPSDMYNSLYDLFQVSSENGAPVMTCKPPEGYFTFGFGVGPAVSIDVLFSEIAVPDEYLPDQDCLFGFEATDPNTPVISFGDTFLRSAYVYYDIDAGTISLAQAGWVGNV